MPEQAVPDEGTFADMFATSDVAQPRRHFQVGSKVAGKVIHLGQDVAFLELGGGSAEGLIELAELEGATVRVGDLIDGVVVRADERGVVVSKKISRGVGRDREATISPLVEASRTGLPVEGVVKGVNKGGLEVEVMGARAFCPISQVDIRFVEDASKLVGQKLEFKVQRAGGRDAVLSRRALLEERRAEQARATRERLAEGAVFEGTVTTVKDFGAFVDIGGLEGMIHVSELSWDRVGHPSEVLNPGDAVQVQVLKIEAGEKKGERISLSVKALRERPPPPEPTASETAAPARPAVAQARVGDVVEATVDKIEPFGVFVRFPSGRGLVPAAETGTPRGSDLRKAFKVGDPMKCLILEIEGNRIKLSCSKAQEAEERAEARAYLSKNKPAGKGFGTLGDLLKKKLEEQ
jgi:small subunit ribosomal protein S1